MRCPLPAGRAAGERKAAMELTELPGLGPKRMLQLEQAGITTPEDLVLFFPRKYLDFTSPVPLAQLTDGQEACVQVRVVSAPWEMRKGGRHILRVTVEDASARASAVWFNQPYLKARLLSGQWLLLSARVRKQRGQLQLTSPIIAQDEGGGLQPVYPTIEGIPGRLLRQWVTVVLDKLPPAEDPLPARIIGRSSLMPRAKAIRTLHQPENAQALAAARRRMAFEELLLFQVAVRSLKAGRQGKVAPAIAFDADKRKAFWRAFPFEPTGAQQRAASEILEDMAKAQPMARLLQGDVGSGKTAVAAIAMEACIQAGYQAALMAPTEILANQHVRSLQGMMGPQARIGLLTSALTASEKKQAYECIKTGQWNVVVGTHALIQQGVRFQRLGLVVADEQHRFGVRQRQALQDKSQGAHMLVMSATPIPRSMALVLYGDLQISILDEMPPGRTPVKTYVVPPHKHDGMYGFIKTQVAKDRQAYVVCPLVEESDKLDVASAEEVYEAIRTGPLRGLSVGLLHGRMSGADKAAAMQNFASGKTQVLVCTTVVEVGVNVPNATVMAVEDATRFGLAQLHQLRGRVGRGRHESFCFLSCETPEGSQRLQLLAREQDGFKIAEADLAMRGPGEFLGDRQSGLADGQLASLAQDVRLLEETRRVLERVSGGGWEEEYALLQRAARERYRLRLEAAGIH
nr:ATP-dependent DNA helicase RecG [bacterium]